MPRQATFGPRVITSMHGLGDNIYQRPFVRAQGEALGDVYIVTPWPQLYADLAGVHTSPPAVTKLRTQAKNVRREYDEWVTPPIRADRLRFTYGPQVSRDGIARTLEHQVSLCGRPFVFDLPDFGPSPVRSDRPIAVIRPVTLRREWVNKARAPRPEYVAEAASILRSLGYHVVSVADVDGELEWMEGPVPEADTVFHRGELPVESLLALIQNAAVVVGGVGWIVPASIAAGTPAVIIGGGQGAHNAPEVVTDPRMDTSRIRFLLPDDYCRCGISWHSCPKGIPDFASRFREALAGVTVLPMARAA